MRTGLMNNPSQPLEDELRLIAAEGHAFVDLTLEPPAAWPVDIGRVRALLDDLGLGVVGHTAHYLPLASPFTAVRDAAVAEATAALDAFAALGARWVNLHPDRGPRLVPDEDSRERCAESVDRLAAAAAARGLAVMVENMSPPLSGVDALRPLLDAAPGVGLHLDVGHANLRGRHVPGLLDAFGDRLAHVHDNSGYRDEHLPLGAGTVDWPDTVRRLRATGYDGTVTLEVFSEEIELVRLSTRLWRSWWAAADGETPS
jgi:sugar phosphate isomerase/epimerase